MLQSLILIYFVSQFHLNNYNHSSYNNCNLFLNPKPKHRFYFVFRHPSFCNDSVFSSNINLLLVQYI